MRGRRCIPTKRDRTGGNTALMIPDDDAGDDIFMGEFSSDVCVRVCVFCNVST